jgi:hypothetical protein
LKARVVSYLISVYLSENFLINIGINFLVLNDLCSVTYDNTIFNIFKLSNATYSF